MPETEHVHGHGHQDGHDATPLIPAHPIPLAELCANVHARVTAFLAADAPTEQLRHVQAQTREALDVIGQALDKYR